MTSIYIGRFLDVRGNFVYRIGMSEDISLTEMDGKTNSHWVRAQQTVVYGKSKLYSSIITAMTDAFRLHNERQDVENPVDTIIYDSEFPKWTMEEALEITCRQAVPRGVLSASNDNGVTYGH